MQRTRPSRPGPTVAAARLHSGQLPWSTRPITTRRAQESRGANTPRGCAPGAQCVLRSPQWRGRWRAMAFRQGAHSGVPRPKERLPGKVTETSAQRGETMPRKVELAGAPSCSGEGGRCDGQRQPLVSTCT
jgi:hypothetical protein